MLHCNSAPCGAAERFPHPHASQLRQGFAGRVEMLARLML
jgi:hypothetical protein